MTYSLSAYIRTLVVGFYLLGVIHALVSKGETSFGVMTTFGRERDILISSEQRRESALDDSLK
jgi:histidine ammonia-lyase